MICPLRVVFFSTFSLLRAHYVLVDIRMRQYCYYVLNGAILNEILAGANCFVLSKRILTKNIPKN